MLDLVYLVELSTMAAVFWLRSEWLVQELERQPFWNERKVEVRE
jgi:hypothetical protein